MFEMIRFELLKKMKQKLNNDDHFINDLLCVIDD